MTDPRVRCRRALSTCSFSARWRSGRSMAGPSPSACSRCRATCCRFRRARCIPRSTASSGAAGSGALGHVGPQPAREVLRAHAPSGRPPARIRADRVAQAHRRGGAHPGRLRRRDDRAISCFGRGRFSGATCRGGARRRARGHLDAQIAKHRRRPVAQKRPRGCAAGVRRSWNRSRRAAATRAASVRRNVCSRTRGSRADAWKDARFSAVAMLTLALGIGASTTVFSVVDAILISRCRIPTRSRSCCRGACRRRGSLSASTNSPGAGRLSGVRGAVDDIRRPRRLRDGAVQPHWPRRSGAA